MFVVRADITSDELLQILDCIYISGVALINCRGRQIAQNSKFLYHDALNCLLLLPVVHCLRMCIMSCNNKVA